MRSFRCHIIRTYAGRIGGFIVFWMDKIIGRIGIWGEWSYMGDRVITSAVSGVIYYIYLRDYHNPNIVGRVVEFCGQLIMPEKTTLEKNHSWSGNNELAGKYKLWLLKAGTNDEIAGSPCSDELLYQENLFKVSSSFFFYLCFISHLSSWSADLSTVITFFLNLINMWYKFKLTLAWLKK